MPKSELQRPDDEKHRLKERVAALERRLAELEQTECWFKAILEYAPLNIYLKDRDGSYLWVNQQFKKSFGEKSDGFIGNTADVHLHGAALEKALRHDRKIIHEGKPSTQEEEIQGRVYRVLKCPVFDDQGALIAVVGFDTDITDLRKAEQKLKNQASKLEETVDKRTAELRESEARFKAFAASAADWFWETDDRLRFTTIRFAENLGRTPWEQLHTGVDGEGGWTAPRQSMGARKPFRDFEYYRDPPDGPRQYLMINAVPVFTAAEVFTGYRGTMRDITAVKRAQETLKRAQKMQAFDQLTGGVAHDFNNLLGVILGNLSLLEESFVGTADQRRLLESAIRGAERGGELNRQLLAFARKQPLAPRVFDLNDKISSLASVLQRTLGESISIDLVADKRLWLCKADPVQVENALLNLAINARDAMPKGGAFTIETTNARIEQGFAARQTEVTAGDYVLLTVTDTGVGMSAEALEQAFEPYFTTKDIGKGTGLGLSMILGFARQSGGHIELDSAEGRGTTVKLFLPRAAHAAEPVALEPSGAPASKSESILVVEDDPDLRAVVVRLLEELSYTVSQAGDAKSALDILASGSAIDLLLTDVALPGGMKGPALAREAKSRHPAVKVVFMSGHLDPAKMGQGKLYDDFVLLEKPFRKQELALKVGGALAGDQPIGK